MTRPKVAVVGLGTMGAQCLWQLSRRRIDVHGYETYAPGHARGAAGGDNRLFRTIELEDSRFSPIVARADELWDELQKNSRRELRTTTGVLVTGAPTIRICSGPWKMRQIRVRPTNCGSTTNSSNVLRSSVLIPVTLESGIRRADSSARTGN